MIDIHRLDAGALAGTRPALAALLVDCVDAGASVSYLPPLAPADADQFWAGVERGVAAGERVVLVARDGADLVGTVQLALATQPNGAHRAEVQKLLVATRARRRGIARALMAALDREARAAGRSLLVLDTAQGDAAEPLYRSLGWTEVGVIPDFALMPGGTVGTVVFYKRI
jgi:GNAT superfamily N-acetyltransferase